MLWFEELRSTGVSLHSCTRGELQTVSERERSSDPPTLQKSRYLFSLFSILSLSHTHRAPRVCFPNNPNIILPLRTWLLSGRLHSFLGEWSVWLPRYGKISHWNEMRFSHRYFKRIKLKLFHHCAFLAARLVYVSRGSWMDVHSNDNHSNSGGDQNNKRKQCRAHRRPPASFQEQDRVRVWEGTVPPVAVGRWFCSWNDSLAPVKAASFLKATSHCPVFGPTQCSLVKCNG